MHANKKMVNSFLHARSRQLNRTLFGVTKRGFLLMSVKAIRNGQQLCCLRTYVLSYPEIEKQLLVVAHAHGGVSLTPVIVICSIYGYCPGHKNRVTSLHHVPPRWNECMASVFGGQDLSRKPLLFQRRCRSTSFMLPSTPKRLF